MDLECTDFVSLGNTLDKYAFCNSWIRTSRGVTDDLADEGHEGRLFSRLVVSDRFGVVRIV